jgi:dTDP-4-amino-4,6-dideoxygalactose transaminase
MPYARHVRHVYAIRTPERDAMQRALAEREIQTGIHYPTPVHLLPAFADLGYHRGDFPVAEAASREVLSLPMYPEMTQAQLETVAGAIRQFHTAAKTA